MMNILRQGLLLTGLAFGSLCYAQGSLRIKHLPVVVINDEPGFHDSFLPGGPLQLKEDGQIFFFYVVGGPEWLGHEYQIRSITPGVVMERLESKTLEDSSIDIWAVKLHFEDSFKGPFEYEFWVKFNKKAFMAEGKNGDSAYPRGTLDPSKVSSWQELPQTYKIGSRSAIR
jgi:hypothetical protein